ncbi:MAG: hypothetical protein ACLU3I_14160 [Acutalibacteraceae bacterium]
MTAARDRPSSRLQFTEEERAAPELQKAIRKSDKAADKLDAAKAAVPGEAARQGTRQPAWPGRSRRYGVHPPRRGEQGGGRELRRGQAGHLTERGMEKAVGYGRPHAANQARADRRLKPWRDVAKAEQAAVKANARLYWQKVRSWITPACVQQSHLPHLAEEAAAAGSTRRHTGRGRGAARVRRRRPRRPLQQRKEGRGRQLRRPGEFCPGTNKRVPYHRRDRP